MAGGREPPSVFWGSNVGALEVSTITKVTFFHLLKPVLSSFSSSHQLGIRNTQRVKCYLDLQGVYNLVKKENQKMVLPISVVSEVSTKLMRP